MISRLFNSGHFWFWLVTGAFFVNAMSNPHKVDEIFYQWGALMAIAAYIRLQAKVSEKERVDRVRKEIGR